MPKKKKESEDQPRLAIIEWLDAFDGPTGWVDPREYKPHFVRPVSIGWVIPNMLDKHITLAGTVLVDRNEDNQLYYSNPAHIPSGMIQSVTYIDVPSAILPLIVKDANTRGLNAD